jgi:hypothetical protein
MMLRTTWGETWRVLAYTLAIALAFVALGRLELALFGMRGVQEHLARPGVLFDPRETDAQLQQQAAQLAGASHAAIAQLPPGHRAAALRVGYALGYASELIGSQALSDEAGQAAARRLAAPQLAEANELAARWQLGAMQPLPSTTLKDFVALGARFEADENALAARIAAQLSPLHRHLYLLGVHLGIEAARIGFTSGSQSMPPVALLRRHATLAGVDPTLWQPLATPPAGETAVQLAERYPRQVQALVAALSQPDAAAR